MTQPALPSLSSFNCEWTYDVFLNFRGEDTRHNFTGNLYNSLCQRGIHTFIDDQGLQRGEEIKPALLKAIRESRIAILVFSKNYASSTFCLDELVNILDCLKTEGRLVWPIFYDVDPSQVRHQTGTYAEALMELEERFQDHKDKVQKWRDALSMAANLSGWDFKYGSESEYEFIRKIIDKVSEKIDCTPLHVADKPVGLESPMLEVISLLGLGSDDEVNMIGIHGIGGIGKSTIARAVYNQIADQFEGCCFLPDIREKASNKVGLVQLQETILHQILGEKDIQVGDVNRGIPIIKRRLRRKKVLVILDDVDNLKQLKVIAGGQDWFGPGSKIIITTRDKHLLVAHGLLKLYEVKQLNDEKALELFSWHAYKNNKIDPNYMDVSNRAVFYACGLPLALEVIGSHLFSKSLAECNSALDKYERTPHKEIHGILKISYDGLEDDEKEIFLDIACFFNTYKMGYVKEMLYIRGFHPENGIRVLTDKSLIKIDSNDCVRMHDLVQDTGREIVRQESPFELGKRSRFWLDYEIVHMLEENTGTDKIEVINLCLHTNKEVQWDGKAFKEMKNLKILIIENAHFSRGPQHLPNSLRVLDWSGYPSSSLPYDFNPKELVILNLPEGCIKLFKSLKMFESLRFMNFEDCKFLSELPSLSGVPNLGALCLDNCKNLFRIDDSIGFLDKLVLLSAQGCTQLEMLVPCIKLTSLETLDLSGCSSLEIFPEVLGRMEYIKDVYLDQTAIHELPFSIRKLVGLQRLYLRGCQRLIQLPRSIHILPKLEVIMAHGCRGIQLFERYEDDKQVSSEMSVHSTMVRNSNHCSLYELYSRRISHSNFIEVCTPWNPHGSLGPLLSQLLDTEIINWYDQGSKESLMSFWFRKQFPRIALCCGGESGMHVDNAILDFKFSVFINGTRQFSSSCDYIFTKQSMRKHVLLCDLRCKAEWVFSEHEWNQVEILSELKHHTWGPQMATMTHNGITMGPLKWTIIYVYEEGINREDVRFKNHSISESQPTPCLEFEWDAGERNATLDGHGMSEDHTGLIALRIMAKTWYGAYTIKLVDDNFQELEQLKVDMVALLERLIDTLALVEAYCVGDNRQRLKLQARLSVALLKLLALVEANCQRQAKLTLVRAELVALLNDVCIKYKRLKIKDQLNELKAELVALAALIYKRLKIKDELKAEFVALVALMMYE